PAPFAARGSQVALRGRACGRSRARLVSAPLVTRAEPTSILRRAASSATLGIATSAAPPRLPCSRVGAGLPIVPARLDRAPRPSPPRRLLRPALRVVASLDFYA